MMRFLFLSFAMAALSFTVLSCTEVPEYNPHKIDWNPSSSSVARSSSSILVRITSSSSVARSSSSILVRVTSSSSVARGSSAVEMKKWVCIDERDNYVYSYTYIGETIWMAENLRYLPEISSGFFSEEEPAYYVAEYIGKDLDEAKNTDNYKTCGALYNYTAALTACPDGWRLPTTIEWNELRTFNGNVLQMNIKLKATYGWDKQQGTDEYGFTALPCGTMAPVNYVGGDLKAVWWKDTKYPRCTHLKDRDEYLGTCYSSLEEGYSVRCVKEDPQ